MASLTVDSAPGGRHPGPRRPPRTDLATAVGVADVRARIAWALAGVTVVLMWRRRRRVGPGRRAPLRDGDRRARLPVRPRRGPRARAVMGALIISRYDRHPIGWLLMRRRRRQRGLPRRRGVRLLGPGGRRTGLRQPRRRRRLGLRAVRRPARDRRAHADVPARPGRPPALAAAGGTPRGSPGRGAPRACSPSSSSSPTAFQLYDESEDIGLVRRADAVARLPRDQPAG